MNSKYWLRLLVSLWLAACSSQSIDFNNLSIEQLTSSGFYAYVLPKDLVVNRGWNQTITMKSFNDHCVQFDTIPESNPIHIVYKDDNRTPFSLEISPVYQAWNRNRQITVIEVNADWIPNREAEYYIDESGGITLKVKDQHNMDVVIHSWEDILGIDEITDLISQLQYRGSSIDSSTNPWEQICGDD